MISEQKPSVKKPVDRGGQPAMILKITGRVEKILTGSISGLDYRTVFFPARIYSADKMKLISALQKDAVL